MRYDVCYLWNFVSEAMAVDIEGITTSLGSSIEQFALSFDTTERVSMTMRTTHDVIKHNGVELCSCPPVLRLVRNL